MWLVKSASGKMTIEPARRFTRAAMPELVFVLRARLDEKRLVTEPARGRIGGSGVIPGIRVSRIHEKTDRRYPRNHSRSISICFSRMVFAR